MNRTVSVMVGCLGVALLFSACATKGYVREQVGSSETKVGQRVDTTEAKLRETSDRTASNTQAIESTGQRLQSREDGRRRRQEGRRRGRPGPERLRIGIQPAFCEPQQVRAGGEQVDLL